MRAAGSRLDDAFATADVAERLVAGEVLRTDATEQASDHLPVVTDLHLDL